MSTRAAAATLALRAKENLIRILFQNKSSSVLSASAATAATGSTTTPRAASLSAGLSASIAVVDHSQYTYSDLRAAYLERIQQLHPDKQHRRRYDNNTNGNDDIDPDLPTVSSTSAPTNNTHESSSSTSSEQFVQLLEAWNRYEAVTKDSSSNKNNLEANFTWFGVGCSFADTDEQREARNRIMDMACRGWLPQGEIGSGTSSGSSGIGTGSGSDSTSWIMSSLSNNSSNNNDPDSATTTTTIRLCCDAMFQGGTTADDDVASNNSTMLAQEETSSLLKQQQQRSSLVSHLIPPHRR